MACKNLLTASRSDVSQSVAHDAFRALVNLSDSPLMITPLSEPAFINFVASYIIVGHKRLIPI